MSWRCQICGRIMGRPEPHRCTGGMRKRFAKWGKRHMCRPWQELREMGRMRVQFRSLVPCFFVGGDWVYASIERGTYQPEKLFDIDRQRVSTHLCAEILRGQAITANNPAGART